MRHRVQSTSRERSSDTIDSPADCKCLTRSVGDIRSNSLIRSGCSFEAWSLCGQFRSRLRTDGKDPGTTSTRTRMYGLLLVLFGTRGAVPGEEFRQLVCPSTKFVSGHQRLPISQQLQST